MSNDCRWWIIQTSTCEAGDHCFCALSVVCLRSCIGSILCFMYFCVIFIWPKIGLLYSSESFYLTVPVLLPHVTCMLITIRPIVYMVLEREANLEQITRRFRHMIVLQTPRSWYACNRYLPEFEHFRDSQVGGKRRHWMAGDTIVFLCFDRISPPVSVGLLV